MDQLSAHLDRGWDLAQRGDAHGAKTSASRAIEVDPDSPEAHNLLGYAAALEGEHDEALEAYENAIMLDDTYVEAMLNAAELHLHPLNEYDDALALCEQVIDLSDYQDEIVDALLLKVEALMGKGDSKTALTVLNRLPEGPYENPTQNFLAGRAYFEARQFDTAEQLLQASLNAEPDYAEAHYYLGLLNEEKGNRPAAIASFLRARELEVLMGVPPWAPNAEVFMVLTEKALGGLKPELRPFLEGAELYVSDLPGPEVVVDGVDPRTLALVDAVAKPNGAKNDATKTEAEPDLETAGVRVFIYAFNVMRAAGCLDAVGHQICKALEQELETLFEEAEKISAAPE